MIHVKIPGLGSLHLEHLVLDVNGTVTNRGVLLDGVAERLRMLESLLAVQLATVDTFGSGEAIARELGVQFRRVANSDDKCRLLEELGPDRCAAIGNGRNDQAMLRAAALGIAVIGPEGAAAGTVAAADIVCRSITEALDLLLDDRLLIATLRS